MDYLSNRNQTKFSENGYSYVFHKVLITTGMAVWRCSNYRDGVCRATVKTPNRNNFNIIARGHGHLCGVQPERVELEHFRHHVCHYNNQYRLPTAVPSVPSVPTAVVGAYCGSGRPRCRGGGCHRRDWRPHRGCSGPSQSR